MRFTLVNRKFFGNDPVATLNPLTTAVRDGVRLISGNSSFLRPRCRSELTSLHDQLVSHVHGESKAIESSVPCYAVSCTLQDQSLPPRRAAIRPSITHASMSVDHRCEARGGLGVSTARARHRARRAPPARAAALEVFPHSTLSSLARALTRPRAARERLDADVDIVSFACATIGRRWRSTARACVEIHVRPHSIAGGVHFSRSRPNRTLHELSSRVRRPGLDGDDVRAIAKFSHERGIARDESRRSSDRYGRFRILRISR